MDNSFGLGLQICYWVFFGIGNKVQVLSIRLGLFDDADKVCDLLVEFDDIVLA